MDSLVRPLSGCILIIPKVRHNHRQKADFDPNLKNNSKKVDINPLL